MASTKAVESSLEGCGVWGCVVGGMLATKLAKYVFSSLGLMGILLLCMKSTCMWTLD